MNKIWLPALLLFAVSNLQAQQDDYAKKILDAMSEKYRAMSSYKADFTYKLENKVEGVDEEFTGEITVKGDKYHLKLSDQEIFNDGKTIWTYIPDAREVNIDNYLPDDGDLSPSNIYTAYKKGYRYRFLEEAKKGAAVLNVIELQPENPNDPNKTFQRVILNINKSDNLIDNWQMFDRMGNVFTYFINVFTPNVRTTDGQFVFDPAKYPGVEVVDMR
jgi:outer membrane lipoprotein carrier protein